MRKIIRYSLHAIGWFLILFTAIIVLAVGIIQTKAFKEKLVSVIENKSPEFINGNLTIGEIGGNFFTHLILKDVLLLNASDTILYMPELEASYNLLPLLHKNLNVEEFSIRSPYINLRQINDSTWNVMQILKPSKPGAEDTVSSGQSYNIQLASFKITGGVINILSPDTMIPRHIQKINSELSFSMVNNLMSVRMKNLSLLTVSPDLALKKLIFNLEQSPDFIKISDLMLETTQNHLDGKVEYFTDKSKKSAVMLKTSPLRMDEFKYYLSGFETQAKPLFYLDASMQNDSVNALMDLSDQNQALHLKIRSPNLYKWLTVKSDSLLIYKLEGKLENIKISHWMDIPGLNYILNGDFTAAGRGTDAKMAEVKMAGNIDNLIIENRKVDRVHLDFGYDKGDLVGSMQGKGKFGGFDVSANIKDILHEPVYQLNLIAKNLDIGTLSGIDTLSSAINMTADLRGKGFDPKSLSVVAVLDITESRIQKINVNTLKAFVQYQKENMNIDSLRFQTNTLTLKAKGNYSFRSGSELRLTADLKNMDEFSSFIPLQDLQTGGHLDAHLKGNPDSLNIDAHIDLPNTKYGDYLLGPVLISARAGLSPKDTTINAQIMAQDLSYRDFNLDSASFNIDGANDSARINGHLVNKDLDTRFLTTIQLGELTKINLWKLAINYKNQLWNLDQSPAVFEISPRNYKIENLSLSNNSGDSIQSIKAKGNINREGKENFNLNIKNIDIKKMAEMTNQKIAASGILNLNLILGGTSRSPLLEGNFAVKNAVINNFPFTELGGTFDYNSNRMNMDMKVLPRDSGKFELSGNMPLRLNLDSMSFSFNKKDSVNVSLVVEKFPLAAIKTIDIVKQITGYIEGGVQMRGSIDSPDLKGNLHLKNASVKVPEYGIDYRDVLFNVDFLRDKLHLDTLYIRTDKGSMTGTGEFNFSSDFYKGHISNSEIKLKFNGFKPVNQRQVNMDISGNASLGGAKGNVVFEGNMEVNKSEIYLPALFNMMGKTGTSEIPEPLLVQAMDSTAGKLDTLVINKVDKARVDSAKWDYFKNLKGKLRFKIPKNVWIKNENMYVEISGDLELIKEQQFFELFGNADVVRGQYELLGRRFVIDKGTINFQGGEKMWPQMSIQASYSFRNTQGTTQKLSVDVEGAPDSLVVNFTLDNSSINEGEAMSYIFFGKSMNELTLDQQQGIAGSGGSMAGQVAASLVSSQLTKFLGSKLNMDYLEIKSEGGFDNASLTVGKYIAKGLFASYEQQFGQTDIKGIPSYQLNLEYEVLKFLFLRMNNSSIDNGFDVIFKFEGK